MVVIAIVVSSPSLFWFSKDEVLAHGPFFPWPDLASSWWVATRYLYSWADGALGSINTEPSGFFYTVLLTFLTQTSLILHLGQGGVFFVGYVSIFLSMFFLLRVLKQSYFSAAFAGVIYLLNPIIFSGLPIEITNVKLMPFNVATPLIVAALVRIFDSKGWRKQLALFVFVIFFPGALGYSSLQYFSIHFIMILVYCLVRLILIIKSKDLVKPVLIKSISVVSLFFLINAFWLLPLLSNIGSSFASRAEPGISDSRLLSYLSSSVSNSLRMMQYSGQSEPSPWIDYYNKPVVILFCLSIVVIGTISLLIKKISSVAIFPTILLLIGLFLSKGTLPFFSGLGKIIFLSVPYVTRLFRNPTYFGSIVAFSTSILFGLTLGYIFDKAAKYKHPQILIPMSIAIFFSILIYGRQFIVGSPINESSPTALNQKTVVPETFIDAAEYIRNDTGDFRIITIPMSVSSRGSSLIFNWSSRYSGVGPEGVWSAKSTFIPTNMIVDDYTRSIFAPTKDKITQEKWITELQNKNVRYVTLHQDAEIPVYGLDSNNENLRTQINDFVRTNPYLENVYSNNQVQIFRLKDMYFHPHVYVEGIPGLSTVFKKNNPTKYSVHIENITTSFRLVFLESFHQQWKVLVNDTGESITENNHLLFDNYANSWIISPSDLNSRHTIDLTIEFVPQRITYVGWVISGLTLLIFLFLWLKSL